ncbi:unnamed protein product [Pelagomonas calceolata]|uniref:Uncharacterized protein n=1 Tax=Pelagomonas calceolata TaxID=35677 RepID=A0A8J2SCT5_9STRA|nr:unnamed protein product [Pelagomonas calceolata]
MGLYIAAVLAAGEKKGCPLPCGAFCLELIDHKEACPNKGSPCSQQELAFGDICTGDATCGDAGRCYVAAAETEAKVLAATTRRRAWRDEATLRRRALSDDGDPTDAPTYWTPPTRSHFQPRDRRFLYAVFIGFVALALGLGAAVAAHAFPLERGRPRLPDLVDTFFDVCRGEAGFYYWFKEWRNRDKVPRVRVVVARHMRESDFRRVAPPPPALSNALVEEL